MREWGKVAKILSAVRGCDTVCGWECRQRLGTRFNKPYPRNGSFWTWEYFDVVSLLKFLFLSLNWPELNLKSTINWMWVGVRDRFYILTSYNEKNSLLKSFKKILKDCPVWVRVAESIALTPEVLWRLGEWWLRQRDLKGRKSLSYLFGWGSLSHGSLLRSCSFSSPVCGDHIQTCLT